VAFSISSVNCGFAITGTPLSNAKASPVIIMASFSTNNEICPGV